MRANGDVIRWTVSDGGEVFREGMGVCSLSRGSDEFRGIFLTDRGAAVWKGHTKDPRLVAAAQGVVVVDYAELEKGTSLKDFTVLLEDGSLIYKGKGTPPAEGVSDIVRIEGSDAAFFGIRESGQLIAWGEPPPGIEELHGTEFVQLADAGFGMVLLDVDGRVWSPAGPDSIISLFVDFPGPGPMVEIAGGFNIYAARRADGGWMAWSHDETAKEVVAVINGLGPNVLSLSFTPKCVAWIEANH